MKDHPCMGAADDLRIARERLLDAQEKVNQLRREDVVPDRSHRLVVQDKVAAALKALSAAEHAYSVANAALRECIEENGPLPE